MAQASNLKLGKISYMNESSYSVVPYNRAYEVAMKADTNVPPEDVEVSATVTITYKI